MATKAAKTQNKKTTKIGRTISLSRVAQLEQRQQQFVEVAEQLFLEHGFANTSVNEVVRIAGGSLATLYAQYHSKEALFDAVMSRRMSSLYSGIFSDNESPKAAPQNVRDGLLQLATRLQTHMLSDRSLALFRLAIHEGPNFLSVRNAVLNKGLNNFLKHLAEHFSRLAINQLQIDDARLAAEEFLTLVQGQQRMIAACGDAKRITRRQREDHVARAVQVFLTLYPPRINQHRKRTIAVKRKT
jgi:AcrR family transcriptional regulator